MVSNYCLWFLKCYKLCFGCIHSIWGTEGTILLNEKKNIYSQKVQKMSFLNVLGMYFLEEGLFFVYIYQTNLYLNISKEIDT